MVTHTKEDLDAFYLSFKDKLPEYKAKNPEVVDMLYGFIDFDQFKKQMINAKLIDRADENAVAEEDAKTSDNKKMLDELLA